MVPAPDLAGEADQLEEVEEAPCPSDAESSDFNEEEDAFLSQLAETLAEPPAKCLKKACSSSDGHADISAPSDWPIEVKSAVAAFLPWRTLPGVVRLSSTWHNIERLDTLWKEYFRIQWPRLYSRKAAASSRLSTPWRSLFRQRWAEPDRDEDAEQEHWNDLAAALDLWKNVGDKNNTTIGCTQKALSEEQQIEHAVRRFKEDPHRLRRVTIPSTPISPGEAGHCSQLRKKCKHCPVPIGNRLDGCLFVCEGCADVHVCWPNSREPCDGAVLSGNNEFLVCTISGRCFDPSVAAWVEEQERCDAPPASHYWDPELNPAQQVGKWFEQGYSMDEEQADHFFDGGAGRKSRLRARCRQSSAASSSTCK